MMFTPDSDEPAVEEAVVPFSAEAEIGHLAERLVNVLMTLTDALFDLAMDLCEDYDLHQDEEED